MKRLLVLIAVLATATAGAIALRDAIDDDRDALVVVHWSNSHPMRAGLLPEMAAEFNAADHETASGQPIEIVVVKCDSAVQVDDLVSRAKGTGRAEDGCEGDDPTIVTPQSGDWLIDLNDQVGRAVVDAQAAEHIAETWLGIVTYRAMAECLGWPDTPIGYQDILDLAADPDGWEEYSDCASTEWGREPLLAFTNPNTSTSGRNVLVSLYSIAAGKAPADLTVDDIERPEVVRFVTDFQQLVDHYMPATLQLNTKIAQGKGYGHFFLLPEDNLVSLYQGNEKAIATDGTEQPLDPVKDLVMIYPEEGSVLNSNPAAVVDAPWVTDEHADAAREWIDFLRDDRQQRKFMELGFRPATGSQLSVDEAQFAEWGLSAAPPTARIEPGDLDPAVLARIIDSWGAVKNPAIVTLVVDASGSMEGEPLAQVKSGILRLLDAMADSDSPGNENQVGLVTFSSEIITELPPAPLRESKYDIADAVNQMQALGGTALYDAIARAIELTDDAPGDPRATRAIVVLSDGAATAGGCLHGLVAMSSRQEEARISMFCGKELDQPWDEFGRLVAIDDVVGDALVLVLDHEIQVFFVGFGASDVNIGRILAQATGAEYQGSTEEDLAGVIEELSGYF